MKPKKDDRKTRTGENEDCSLPSKGGGEQLQVRLGEG